jgi:ribonucleoside-diphosphate reductase beta chain
LRRLSATAEEDVLVNSFDQNEQVDPATVEDSKLEHLEPLLPRQLYFLWERRHWAAGALNFEQDRRDWAALHDDQRSMLISSIAPIFVGEERVAAAFAPIVLSAEDEQETAYLSTQQVDEARHSQFHDRFWREVLVPEDDTSKKALQGARARCNDAFTELFDRRLTQAVDRLRADPQNTDAKVEAVTIYHLAIEGTMALTALHFLLDYFSKKSICPGISEGFRNIKRDEHHHVAFGTWFLRRKCREQERYGLIVQRVLMELLPVAASILIEGGGGACDGLDPIEFLDYSGAEVSHYALLSLSRRLTVIGGATQEIRHFVASGVWRASRVLA